jgi:S-adenosylmethionine decarboxylase
MGLVSPGPDHLVPVGHADAGEMCSYAVDMWVHDAGILTDEDALMKVMRDCAGAGHAVVLGTAAHRFPNGALTAVLVLSQSHLSVHTWPEHGSANFDLLTCGRLNGELMIAHLEDALQPKRVNITRVIRDVRQPLCLPAEVTALGR